MAFIEADAEQAKRVTISSQWDRIDELAKRLRPMEWPVSRKGWEDAGTSCVGRVISEDEEIVSCFYACESSGVVYCFHVEDIVLKRTGEGWKVHDWGFVGLDGGSC